MSHVVSYEFNAESPFCIRRNGVKRIISIALGMFLGALASTIVHGLVELWYLGLQPHLYARRS